MGAAPKSTSGSEVALGAVLAAAAGAVDVLAYTRLGRAFASVVTGNIVVIGVSLGRADLQTFAHVATAIASYGAGVAIGNLGVRHAAGTTVAWPRESTVICTGELAVLFVLAGLWMATGGTPHGSAQYVGLVAAAVAMGLQSAAFSMVHLPGVTTTYFTGTLTTLLSGLITAGRLNVAALLALAGLLAGAGAAGLLIGHAATLAGLLPVALVTIGLAIAVRHHRESTA